MWRSIEGEGDVSGPERRMKGEGGARHFPRCSSGGGGRGGIGMGRRSQISQERSGAARMGMLQDGQTAPC